MGMGLDFKCAFAPPTILLGPLLGSNILLSMVVQQRVVILEFPQETFKHSKTGLAQSLWSLLGHTSFCLSPPSVSGEYGV